jgi:hypothetical protein
MSLDLPAPIAAYFAADKGDSDAIAQCFTEHAVVKDEGHTYSGRSAIKRWRSNTSARYKCTPIAVEHEDGKTVVTSHLVGDFPGSPVDLRYFFLVDDDKISSWRSCRELRS